MIRLFHDLCERRSGPTSWLRASVAALACTWWLVATSAQAQRELKIIPPTDPELERATFQVADGFEVNLFASDPRIAKPIQMNFDPAGRLWIASSEVYPHIQPGQQANDKILIVEDVDGDGQADKTNVFAEGLLIPTGVEPGDGGAYVANSTELVHFQDVDGDGRADTRRVLLSGFGTEDTHHILHTLRWGPDGLLYFNQSIYIHSHIETPYGVRRLGGGGIWHFRPETRALEVYARGFVNTWGHHFDRWGQSFATDGAFGEGINYVFPGATFCHAPGAARILQGLNPGSPKHCGLEIVDGRHLPDDWQGSMLTNDFRAHRVCRFVLAEEGSGYSSREQVELIKSTHVAFRPIDIKMGPDGAIYIADWYNPIIQHGEVDFRDPRRDHTHGRIWRVTAKGRPLVARPQLVGATTAQLLDALRAPESWTRHQAKRLLKERGAQIMPELTAWVAGIDRSSEQAEQQRLEALWVYQALDVVEPTLLSALLRSPDHHVRAAATRVVYHWQARLDNPLALLAAQVADDHPQVRLEAVRALSQIGRLEALDEALVALDRPMDGNIDFALWLACRELEPIWMPALQAGRYDFGGDARRLEFALRAGQSAQGMQALIQLLQQGKIPQDREESVLRLIASVGNPAEMGLVFQMAVIDAAASQERKTTLLRTLVDASRQRKVRPEGDLSALAALLTSSDDALRSTAARAAGLWQVQALRPRLAELAAEDRTQEALRSAAIDALADLGGDESKAKLEILSGEKTSPSARATAIAALASLDLPLAAQRAAAWLAAGDPAAPVTALIEVFLARKQGAGALTAALAGKSLPADVAKLALRAARSSAQPPQELIDALAMAGGLSAAIAPPAPEEIRALVQEALASGDAGRGERVFRGREQGCLKCHAIAGSGGQVGPDLASIGASAQADYLAESILLPSKAIKENYHSLAVVTDDGRLFTGVKVRQTDDQLILRDSEDREITVPLASIAEQTPVGSLMPVGLADGLTRAELVDLVRFLSELGKAGPYAVGNARVVRRWQVLRGTPDVLERGQRNSVAAVAVDDHLPWEPAYSSVGGLLPVADIPTIALRQDAPAVGFVRCAVQVTTPGPITFLLNSPEHLSLWIDGAPQSTVVEKTTVDLAVGTHTLTFAVDLRHRQQPLRLEVDQAAESTAKFQLVGGK